MVSGTYKHGQVRTMFHYAAAEMGSFVDETYSVELQLAKTTMQSLSSMISLLDSWGAMLTEAQRDRVFKLGCVFRDTCSVLLATSKARGSQDWHCTPKFHQLDHLIELLKTERFNSLLQFANWTEEAMMGLVARIRRSNHAGHCGLTSSLRRYALWLHVEHSHCCVR